MLRAFYGIKVNGGSSLLRRYDKAEQSGSPNEPDTHEMGEDRINEAREDAGLSISRNSCQMLLA
jgi:hypothetical protein